MPGLKMTLKVTNRCMGKCPGCAARISWYRTKSKNSKEPYDLDLDLAKQIISEASEIGFEKLVLSGGEPTSYPHLLDVIHFAEMRNFTVKLNTNGWNLSSMLDALHQVGLDSIALSLYSLDRSTYFLLRGNYGMFERALTAVDNLSKYIAINPNTFSVILQTIITKANFREIPALLRLSIKSGFSALATSYLEDAHNHPELRMAIDDIQLFRTEVIPELFDITEALHLAPIAQHRNIKTLQAYFCPQLNTVENWAQGIYRPTGQRDCEQSKNFLLVYPGGKVAPCYGFEYMHVEDYMDTVKNKTISDVMNGEKFNGFAEKSFGFCNYCPVGLHQWLDLSSS